VAIAGEKLGHEEFSAGYWKGELLIDENKAKVWPIIGGEEVGIFGTVGAIGSYFTGGKIRKDIDRCKKAGIKGNLEGEGKKTWRSTGSW